MSLGWTDADPQSPNRIPTILGHAIEVSPSGLVALLDLCLQLALCRADLNASQERHRAEQTYRRMASTIGGLIAQCTLADQDHRPAVYAEVLTALEAAILPVFSLAFSAYLEIAVSSRGGPQRGLGEQ